MYAQLGRGRTTSPLISKDDEDPLGISDEGNRAKSEDEMLKMFPDGKLEHAKLILIIHVFVLSVWELLKNCHICL